MLKEAGYIVTTGMSIYGFGETAEQAIEEAREWVDDPEQEIPICNWPAPQKEHEMHGNLFCAPATKALIDYVKEYDGDIAHFSIDGIYCTEEEADEELS